MYQCISFDFLKIKNIIIYSIDEFCLGAKLIENDYYLEKCICVPSIYILLEQSCGSPCFIFKWNAQTVGSQNF